MERREEVGHREPAASDFAVVLSAEFAVRGANEKEVVFKGIAGVVHGQGFVFVLENPKAVPISGIVGIFVADTSNLPAVLDEVAVTAIRVNYRSANDSAFGITLESTVNLTGTDLGVKLSYQSGNALSSISGVVALSKKGPGPQVKHEFALRFITRKTPERTDFIAGNYSLKSKVKLSDLAAAIFPASVPFTLPAVEIENLDVFLIRGKIKKEKPEDTDAGYAMGFRLKIETRDLLKQLPVVGQVAAEYLPFELREILLIYLAKPKKGGNPFSSKEAIDALFREELKVESEDIKVESLDKALNVFVDWGPRKTPEKKAKAVAVVKPATVPQESSAQPGQPAATPAAQLPEATNGPDAITWKEVGFSALGIDIKRVGYLADLKNNKISLFIDAGLSLSVLRLQVRGLGIHFDTRDLFSKKPEISFAGLGFSLKKDPFELSGAFLETQMTLKLPNQPDQKITAYSGAVIFKITRFRIAGIGSYARYLDKGELRTSLFIFAAFDGPLGGDPAFFITGMAAGFGYNRTIRIPAIESVRDFPLVAIVLSPDADITLMDMLDNLQSKDCIPVSPGDYWLAIGIKFTTYEILESFVLLVVLFGNELTFRVIGISILEWPKKGENKLAKVNLVIDIKFGTKSDSIDVFGLISRGSWLFSEDCHLGGGFAFVVWIKGPFAGDFVVTLGGYHPAYTQKGLKPAHFPDVDRLSLSWQITPEASLVGSMYFALTSSAIMAGGDWKLTYNGSIGQATARLWADLLIAWAPFYYDVTIGVTINVHIEVDLLIKTARISADVEAMLHLWGPPFTGLAHVRWECFSVEVEFGKPKEVVKPPLLGLGEFCAAFIPGTRQLPGLPVTVVPLKLSVEEGLLGEFAPGGKSITLVRAAGFSFRLESLLPLGQTPGQEIGVAPIGAQKALGKLYFCISRHNSGKQEFVAGNCKPDAGGMYAPLIYTGPNARMPELMSTEEKPEPFEFEHLLGAFAAALWAPYSANTPKNEPTRPEMLKAGSGLLITTNRVADKKPSGVIEITQEVLPLLKTVALGLHRKFDAPTVDVADIAAIIGKRDYDTGVMNGLAELFDIGPEGINAPDAVGETDWLNGFTRKPAICSLHQRITRN